MLTYFLYGIFILACFALIITVLLQPGKADAGALFTSSVSSTAFGPRGTQTILAKITIGAAIFMLGALTLSLGIGGPRSVMEGGSHPANATPTPATTATPDTNPAPAAQPSQDNAASSPVNANANTTATGTKSNTPSAAASSPKAQTSPAKKP